MDKICRFVSAFYRPNRLSCSGVNSVIIRHYNSQKPPPSGDDSSSKPTSTKTDDEQAGEDKELVKTTESKEIDKQKLVGETEVHFNIQRLPGILPDCEDPDVKKTHVFQELRRLQNQDPIYTMKDAADYRTPHGINIYFKYPALAEQHVDSEYSLRGYDNQDTLIFHFPEVTDYLIAGSGLMGSAAAYYLKKQASRACDVLVLDKNPYSPHNSTALCNGLISVQSKSQVVSRVANVSKELIRNLRNEVLVTPEDFNQIKYRPVTHLILWPESEVGDVIEATTQQIEDGCHTEVKLPHELERTFPWLKACDSDIAIGSHGNQDEALVDPIGLRNLYRTLAQAYGANFLLAEVIDFNTMFSIAAETIFPFGAGAVVCRLPVTGELRSVSFAKILLSVGHNTPFLEARSEMETYMRDQIGDLHFLQPKLRICFSFHSIAAPVINFPVITDTDGSMLIRDDFYGDFKYYLNYSESAKFFDNDQGMFMDFSSEDPYVNLIHTSSEFRDHFNNVLKPKLVSRIPLMEDAVFNSAQSGFENHNSHDGCPIVGPHPFHSKVLVSGGFGSRMMTHVPAFGAILTELTIDDEEETLDLNNFYWNRVIKGRSMKEFKSLVR